MIAVNKYILTGCLFFLAVLSITAQVAEIKFERSNWNFGRIQEEKGNVSYIFKFENTGKGPLVINRVSASCGCTTPEYSQEPIAPGKSGQIKVIFDPRNRPGAFQKQITVITNAKEQVTRLTIVGEVISKKSKQSDFGFTYNLDGLRMSSNSLSFASVMDNEVKTMRLSLMNTSQQTIIPSFSKIPPHITVAVSPRSIAPQATAELIVTYNARTAKDYGIRSDILYIHPAGNKTESEQKRIYVSAYIRENFNRLTDAERKNAPIITTSLNTIDFGEVSDSDKKKHSFSIQNSGLSPLLIRKISCANSAIKLESIPTAVAPKSKGEIQILIDGSQLNGRMVDNIVLISNDPNNPQLMISLLANKK